MTTGQHAIRSFEAHSPAKPKGKGGLFGLVGFGRGQEHEENPFSGTFTVYPDRLEVFSTAAGVRAFPFEATPYVRDLKWKKQRGIVVADPAIRVESDPIYSHLFASESEYDAFSETLQRAHSDYWLGPNFPDVSQSRDLDFWDGPSSEILTLRRGALYYQNILLDLEVLSSYEVIGSGTGHSMEETKDVIRLTAERAGEEIAIRLQAGILNHKLSLERVLDEMTD